MARCEGEEMDEGLEEPCTVPMEMGTPLGEVAYRGLADQVGLAGFVGRIGGGRSASEPAPPRACPP